MFPAYNQHREDVGEYGAYGLSSLAEKTRTSNHFQMLQQRQHILPSYFKTPSVVVVWGFNSQLPAQQEHLCDVERNDTSTSKPVARQSNLLNHFPYIQAVRRSAKLQNKDLPFRSALFILTVSTNAFHSANLFLFSHHHIPTNSEAPFSSFKYTHNIRIQLPHTPLI